MKVTPYDFKLPRPADGSVRVVEIDYQRNGVCGHGFFTVRMLSREAPERPLIGVVFDYCEEGETPNVGSKLNPAVAIVDPSDLTLHFRGDCYAAGLHDAIRARYEEIWGT